MAVQTRPTGQISEEARHHGGLFLYPQTKENESMTVKDYSLLPTRVLGAVATETGAVYQHLAKTHGEKVHVIFTPQPRIGEMLKILEEIPTAKLDAVTVIPAPADLVHHTTLSEWLRGGTPTGAAQAIKTAQIEDMRADGSTYWVTRADYMDSQDAQELYGEWTAQTFEALEGALGDLRAAGKIHIHGETPAPLDVASHLIKSSQTPTIVVAAVLNDARYKQIWGENTERATTSQWVEAIQQAPHSGLILHAESDQVPPEHRPRVAAAVEESKAIRAILTCTSDKAALSSRRLHQAPRTDAAGLIHKLPPEDWTPTGNEKIEIRHADADQSVAFRKKVMHRFTPRKEAGDLFVFADDYLIGVINFYYQFAIPGGDATPKAWESCRIHVKYTYGAYTTNGLNLTKFVTILSCLKPLAVMASTPKSRIYVNLHKGIRTTNRTRHPEAKQMRGVMEFEHRHKEKDDTFRLSYTYDWDTGKFKGKTPQELWVKYVTQWDSQQNVKNAPPTKRQSSGRRRRGRKK